MTTEDLEEERRTVSRDFTFDVQQALGKNMTIRATRDGRIQLNLFSLSEEEVKDLQRLAKKHGTNNVHIELRYLSIMTEIVVE